MLDHAERDDDVEGAEQGTGRREQVGAGDLAREAALGEDRALLLTAEFGIVDPWSPNSNSRPK
jgi:hypothetical protein